jgi:hypothetical protein
MFVSERNMKTLFGDAEMGKENFPGILPQNF